LRSAAATPVLIGFTLAGRNTIAGLGRDIERGGEELRQEARKTQRKM
jgi:predicted small secreted protein